MLETWVKRPVAVPGVADPIDPPSSSDKPFAHPSAPVMDQPSVQYPDG